MKLRNVVWPVVIFGSLSLAGACSGGGDGGAVGGGATGGDAAEGGGDGNGTAGTKTTGGTKSTSGSSSGGASDGGGDGVGGDAVAGGSTGGAAGGAGPDLCADSDLTCEDDNDPCTEDECNPATGTCGIPRTGTSCDDGLFCNGDDTCNEGACTEHEGDPCNGQTCNEAADYCECSVEEDCSPDEPGEWSTCEYASECIETGKRSRPITTFACTKGKCVQGAAVEMEDCTRDTDTVACTSDGKVCNGAEFCKAGNCAPQGDADFACKDQPAGSKACLEGATASCKECNGTTPCGVGKKCCCSGCIAEGDTCPKFCGIIIDPKIIMDPKIVIGP